MTKNQVLILLRHLREARRAYQDNMAASKPGMPGMTFYNEAESALNEVNKTLSWVEKMSTSD